MLGWITFEPARRDCYYIRIRNFDHNKKVGDYLRLNRIKWTRRFNTASCVYYYIRLNVFS